MLSKLKTGHTVHFLYIYFFVFIYFTNGHVSFDVGIKKKERKVVFILSAILFTLTLNGYGYLIFITYNLAFLIESG